MFLRFSKTLTDTSVVCLDATKAMEKQSRGHSPHVSAVNLFDFDAEGTDTTTETERNVSLSSYGLTLLAEETIGEISSHLKVAGTCSVVSGEQIFLKF